MPQTDDHAHVKKATKSRAWPDRVRKLLGPNGHMGLFRLTRALNVTESLLLDWLMGKKKPSKKLAKKIKAMEREERAPNAGRLGGYRPGMFGGHRPYRPWYSRTASPRKEPAPALPREGPLGYERYLDLLNECSHACLSRWDNYRMDDDEYHWRPAYPGWWKGHGDTASSDRKQAFRRATERLEDVKRRFADEIRGFPLTMVATREALGPEEVRILAYLLKEDIAVFEGRGSAPGRALVQIACGPAGDRLAARKILAPEGMLRKSGLLERENRGGSFFGFGRGDGPSVLDGSYTLTKRGRQQLLGPLLTRSVSEDKQDGVSRVSKPRFGLDAVVLSARHREQIADFRAELRHRKLLYETWGLSSVVHYGRGLILLFEGPPGTGKTMLAEALAGEEGLKFMSARFPKLVSMWVGETEKNIERLFREARESGTLLFIDEADGIFGSRELAQHSWEVRDVNVLLKELEDYEGVCVLATNNVVVLDSALESRLSLRLEFGMPDADMRLAIWKKHLPPQLPLGSQVDLLLLARRYEISGRDIKQAVLAAARAVAARGAHGAVVEMADLERAAAERLKEARSIGFTKTVGTGDHGTT